MKGAQGLAGAQSPLQELARGELAVRGVCVRVCKRVHVRVFFCVCVCVIASAGLAARFTVGLVGVDNSIREETDLEAERRRKREMTACSSSDQYCLVMTP